MRKKVIITHISFLAALVTFGWLASTVHMVFFIAFMVTFIAYATVLMSFSCPQCSTPLLTRHEEVFGLPASSISPWPPEKCPKCSHSLDRVT